MPTHESIPDWNPDLAADLLQYAEAIGLTPGQAALILRNREADDELRADANLSVIKEQGEIDERLDLRLIPYGARLMVSVSTFSEKNERGRPRIGQQEHTFIKGVNGFQEKRVDSRSMLVYGKLFSEDKKYKVQHTSSKEFNRPVALSGATYLGYESGDLRHYGLTPFITKLGSLCNTGGPPADWSTEQTATSLFVVGGKSGAVQAATLEYRGQEPLVVFGEPFNIADR
jgi:hypothetical protein